MEPIFGFILFFVALIIVAVVANKRGRSGALYFIVCAIVGFLLVILIRRAGGSGLAAGFGAFVAPIGGFFFALASRSSEQLAVEHGAHGDYKKCPYCAESVRREAIKCKHCGSALEPEDAGASADEQRQPKGDEGDMLRWVCRGCKEENPETFEICWKCGKAK